MKKTRKKIWIAGIMVGLILFLTLFSWVSTSFSDAYIAYVFPIWVNTLGRLTGSLPFSLGEWMIVLGVLITVVALLGIFVIPLRKLLEKRNFGRKVLSFGRRFYVFFGWTLLGVCLIMTCNCFVLYHASTFSEKYFGKDTEEYTLEQLIRLRNHVVKEANSLCLQMERNSEGDIVYTKSILDDGRETDLGGKAVELMQKLGEKYPQLDGFYPKPKKMFFSDFMCQQYMMGYYFPFSMEANYNGVMCFLNIPQTMCHELAHLRGYIFEDEANFISYLACVESEDLLFRYSGYLSVLNYLENDVYKAWKQDRDGFYLAAEKAGGFEEVLDQVTEDNLFVTEEEWERINGKAVIQTEVVEKAADTFVDTTLKVNGVKDGSLSYSRVVGLLLQYYAKREF